MGCCCLWQAAPHAVVIVVANKCDLENARAISTEQGQSFADEHGCKFKETSASDNVNVTEVSNDYNMFMWKIKCMHLMERLHGCCQLYSISPSMQIVFFLSLN